MDLHLQKTTPLQDCITCLRFLSFSSCLQGKMLRRSPTTQTLACLSTISTTSPLILSPCPHPDMCYTSHGLNNLLQAWLSGLFLAFVNLVLCLTLTPGERCSVCDFLQPPSRCPTSPAICHCASNTSSKRWVLEDKWRSASHMGSQIEWPVPRMCSSQQPLTHRESLGGVPVCSCHPRG